MAFVRAGLWEQDVPLSQFGVVNFDTIYKIAQEQSVVGLLAAGFEHVADLRIPQEVSLAVAGDVLQIENVNTAMDEFIEQLILKLRQEDIYALLLKGQGIAQCYERPLWRASGDVDLFLSEKNYKNATHCLKKVADYIDNENAYNKHLALNIDPWVVELHGTLRSGLWGRIDKTIDKVQCAIFYEGKVRSWKNGHTQVFIPNADEDVIYVFSHILQHFYREGIGLRQICDWCRLIWTYRATLDHGLLDGRLREMGVMSEWRAFSSLAVNHLGMPVEAMPLYSSSTKWKKKADKILRVVLETGNFGQNIDRSYLNEYSVTKRKLTTLYRRSADIITISTIFPLDSIKVWINMILNGVKDYIKGLGNRFLF